MPDMNGRGGRVANLEERFTWIFEAHYEAVWRYSARRVGDDLASDVGAEVFTIVWRRFDQVPESEAEALPWLLGVARNVVANEQRRERRRNRLVSKLGGFVRSRPPITGMYVSAETTVPGVVAAMRRLSLRDQEALQLVGWDGLSASEAARVVGCSPSAMANRISRARQRLKAAMSIPESGSSPSRQVSAAMGRYVSHEEEEVAYEK
jgi:RNA polymerase sigma-70 factor, ECF subfamily